MSVLTYLSLDKMAAIMAGDIFLCIFVNEKLCIKMSLKTVPKVLIDNTAALIHVMAWRRTGGKPLPEPMLIQFLNICGSRGDELTHPWANRLFGGTSNDHWVIPSLSSRQCYENLHCHLSFAKTTREIHQCHSLPIGPCDCVSVVYISLVWTLE